MIPNLSVDHLAAQTPLANTSQLASAIIERWAGYEIARRDLGLSVREYSEFVGDIRDDKPAVSYGVLPAHIDAMVGRRPSGAVYVLHDVAVPAATSGWTVRLRDGVTVYVPAACGNLSADTRGRHIAGVPFRNTSFRGYFQPVAFAPPVAPPLAPTGPGAVVTADVPPATQAAPQSQRKGFAAWWVAVPVAAAAVIGGSGGGSPSSPVIPPCSAGSNSLGVCQR